MSSIAKKYRSIFLSAATFVSVILAVHFVWGWNVLLSFWQAISLPYLILFTLSYWFSYVVRSLRISLYFSNHKLIFPTKIVLPIVIKQTFWANLLPAKAGEISFPILMKKAFATPYTQSVSALFVLRLFDAYVLASIAIAVYAFSISPYAVYLWLVVAFFIPLIGIYLKRKLIGLTYYYRRKPKMTFVWRILTNIPDTPKQLLTINSLTWVNWAIKILLFAGILASMTRLELAQTTVAALLGEISGMLPGLPGGFGSYEAAVSFGLMAHGNAINALESSDIIAAALNAHFFILFNSILAAMIAFILPSHLLIENKL